MEFEEHFSVLYAEMTKNCKYFSHENGKSRKFGVFKMPTFKDYQTVQCEVEVCRDL